MTAPLAALRDAQASGLLPPGRLLVACSGGADSLALLHAAASLGGWTLGAAVVDHGLGPHGAAACRAVEAAGRALGVPVFVLPVQLGAGQGPEDQARRARLTALEACARSEGYPCVALAHTREDQVETVLMRLAEGAGVRGLAGMAAARGCFRRPWLAVARADVRAWGERAGLQPVLDPTNADDRYLRNRVRHVLLPAFDQVFGSGWRAAAAASADHARQADALVDVLADDAEARGVSADGEALVVAGLDATPAVVRRRVLARVLRRLGAEPRRSRGAIALVEAAGPGPTDLPGGVRVWRAGETLRLAPMAPPPGPTPPPQSVPGPGVYHWGSLQVRVAVDDGSAAVRIAAAAAPFPWTLRAAEAGERVRLLGAPGHRPLARAFSDAGVPIAARRGPVLADAAGVIWVHGLRATERVRHTAGPAWRVDVVSPGESSGSPTASDA
ncbi:MAG: tRNA lysidine(34) synthetase TilS [Myxococcales bacterium]|nr:tRNA lysidine(34) synthetase TilS [Myxococcales bacterium]